MKKRLLHNSRICQQTSDGRLSGKLLRRLIRVLACTLLVTAALPVLRTESYEMLFHTQLLIENECYIDAKESVVRGIMVHSTGVNTPNLSTYVAPDDGIVGGGANNVGWNTALPGGREVAAHAFIGKDENGVVRVYQTLPWEIRGWHSGSANMEPDIRANNANRNGYIGFEMCEDDLTDGMYFEQVYAAAVELTASLCLEYKIKPEYPYIIGHKEGNELQIASAHVDPDHWFKRFGKSMDTFRRDVALRVIRQLEKPATPTSITLTIDGVKSVAFDGFTINENSIGGVGSGNEPNEYVSLDELTAALEGTGAEFSVSSDSNWSPYLNLGEPANLAGPVPKPTVSKNGKLPIAKQSLNPVYSLGRKTYVTTYILDDYPYVNIFEIFPWLGSDITTDGESTRAVTTRVLTPAFPQNSALLLDDFPIELDSYNINGSNYFRLRDLALIMSGTFSQFDVEWDNDGQTVVIRRNVAYTALEDELTVGTIAYAGFVQTTSISALIDGELFELQACNINGNNYFKLRDLAVPLRFEVDWDGKNVIVDTVDDFNKLQPPIYSTNNGAEREREF
jgi:hypothetical protein